VPDRLSPLDVSFLYFEEPTTPMHVGGVAIFQAPEAGFDYERLVTQPLAGRFSSGTARKVYFGRAAGFIDTPVIARGALDETWCPGPLIIEEYDATCVVPHDARARLDALGNIEIELPEGIS